MKYNISTNSAPKMPKFGRGTDCIKILLSQVSKDVQEPIVPMLFPIFGAHISGAEFQYPDLSWKEPLAKAICRDFRQHDEAEEKKSWNGRSRRTRKALTRRNQCAPM